MMIESHNRVLSQVLVSSSCLIFLCMLRLLRLTVFNNDWLFDLINITVMVENDADGRKRPAPWFSHSVAVNFCVNETAESYRQYSMNPRNSKSEEKSSDFSRAEIVDIGDICRDDELPSASAFSSAADVCDGEDDEYSIGDEDENELDDEATIEQEEKLQNSNEIASELEALQKEQDMPIEDLMRLYGCGQHDLDAQISSDGGNELNHSSYMFDEPNSSSSYENNSFRSDYVRTVTTTSSNLDENDAEDEGEKTPLDIRFLASENSIFEDDDEDYKPPEDEWRKEIRVGELYQADVDDFVIEPLSQPSEMATRETILFDTGRLTQESIENYLQQFQSFFDETPPSSFVIGDNQIALEILCQNDYNVVEALSCISNYDYQLKKSMRSPSFGWTDVDRQNFENCLRTHGKDFNFVSRCLADKTMRQIVQYYYHWKISPHYAHFVASLEKDYNDYLFTIQQMQENESASYQSKNYVPSGENHPNQTNSSQSRTPLRPPLPFRISNECGRTKLRWTAAGPPPYQPSVDLVSRPNHHPVNEHYSTHAAGCNLLPHMEALNCLHNYSLTANEHPNQ